jgi:transmembrane sensor
MLQSYATKGIMPLQENDIQRILQAYLEGRATPEERELLDKFFQDHKNEVSEERINPNEYGLIEHQLRLKIKQRIAPARKPRKIAWLALAASISAILLAAFVFMYRSSSPEVVMPAPVAVLQKATVSGQKLTIKLPDGSVVKLNSNSSLSFPERFTAETREVTLQGEGFFTIVHNPSIPFVVHASQGSTTVLGTTFNVKDREGKTAITLVTGKVEVAKDNAAERIRLKPNQQALLPGGTHGIDTLSVDVSKYIQWKDNVLAFDNTLLADAVVQLEEWYGVEIKITNALKGCRITGRYESESLENVLQSLQFMLKGNYTIKDKKVTLSGKGCGNK